MPELAWGFYGHRLKLYRATTPHIGFEQLLDIGNSMSYGYFVYTSNVDGHFQKAGFDPDRIVECHGSIHYLQCTCLECVDVGIWSADDYHPQFQKNDCTLVTNLPKCPDCDEVSRPNILMFSDFFGWNDERLFVQNKRYEDWMNRVSNPVIIECGAGTTVPTIRKLGEKLSAPLIRINTAEAMSEKTKSVCIQASAKNAIAALRAGL